MRLLNLKSLVLAAALLAPAAGVQAQSPQLVIAVPAAQNVVPDDYPELQFMNRQL